MKLLCFQWVGDDDVRDKLRITANRVCHAHRMHSLQLVNVWAIVLRDQIDQGECVKWRRDNIRFISFRVMLAHINRKSVGFYFTGEWAIDTTKNKEYWTCQFRWIKFKWKMTVFGECACVHRIDLRINIVQHNGDQILKMEKCFENDWNARKGSSGRADMYVNRSTAVRPFAFSLYICIQKFAYSQNCNSQYWVRLIYHLVNENGVPTKKCSVSSSARLAKLMNRFFCRRFALRRVE